MRNNEFVVIYVDSKYGNAYFSSYGITRYNAQYNMRKEGHYMLIRRVDLEYVMDMDMRIAVI